MSDKPTSPWPPAIPAVDLGSELQAGGGVDTAPSQGPSHDARPDDAHGGEHHDSHRHSAAIEDPDGSGRSAPKGERAEIGQPYVRPSRLAILVALLAALGLWQGPRILVIVAAVVVMIFFHELGHFVMARRADMKVTEFMIGFGPRIFSFRKGDVEYGLKAIPAGAYVKIIGMADVEEVPPQDEPRTYRQKGYLARMGVAVAGSTMHFLMALVLIGASFVFVGVGEPENWKIDNISPGSAAERAGIELGDKVVSFDGKAVETWDEMAELARENPDQDVDIVVERDGEEVSLAASITSRFYVFGTNSNEFQVYSDATGRPAVSVDPNNGAAKAGVADGSVIVAVDGVSVSSGTAIAEAINSAAEGGASTVVFTLMDRDGATSDASVSFGSGMATNEPVGFFGVGQELVPTKYSPIAAIPESFRWFGEVTTQTIGGVWNFFQPSNLWNFVERVFTTAPTQSEEPETVATNSTRAQESLEQDSQRMMSIVGAVSLGEQIAADGWGNVLQFLALLNMAIGIFNLIPLPPFDGGHVLIGTYERVRELLRRDGRRYFADYNKVMPVAMGVIMVMVAIGLMAIYLDLADPVQI